MSRRRHTPEQIITALWEAEVAALRTDVMRLASRFARYGRPEHLRSDNGPEFTAKLVRRWFGQARGADALHRARKSVGERLQRELQRQAEGRVLERRSLLHTARGRRPRRAVEKALQYRSTSQRLGPVYPPPRRRSNHRLGSLECPSSGDRRWLNV